MLNLTIAANDLRGGFLRRAPHASAFDEFLMPQPALPGDAGYSHLESPRGQTRS
jgi:hypothetical protein